MNRLKTYAVLSEGLEYLKSYVRSREALGEPVTVFCEDRLTMLAEQAVVEATGGTFLSSVTTFARFLSGEGKILSKQGSVMAVGKILSDNAQALRCFSDRARARNGAKTVYEMIAQLSASKVTPEMLLLSETKNGLLYDKLCDLSLVYGKYLAFLNENGYVDENKYLSYLAPSIERSGLIRTGSVVFLGFSSFTAQAQDGIRSAMNCARDVMGIFPGGEGGFYTRQAVKRYQEVAKEFGGAVVEKGNAYPDSPARFMSRNLFRPEVFAKDFIRRSGEGAVTVVERANEEQELRFTLDRIVKYVMDGGRYRDVTVLLPDVKKYELHVSKLFKEYGVPYYADKKKPLSEHPFAKFALNVLRAVKDGSLPETVNAVLSSVYFGDNGEYRNYLAKFSNFRGGEKKEIKEDTVLAKSLYAGLGEAEITAKREYLQTARTRLNAGMGAFKRKMSGVEFVRGVQTLQELFSAEQVTESLAKNCPDPMQAEFLRCMDKKLSVVLGEIGDLLGGETYEVGEFLTLLEDGLTAMEVSLLPMYSDVVFIGDLSASRTRDNTLVFALGLTDEVPAYGEDTALLSDRDMQDLNEVKVRIEPSVAEVNERTRESVAINLCAFSEKLYLLFPSGGAEERARSEILRYVKAMFTDVNRKEDLFPYACARPSLAVKNFLRLKNAVENSPEQAKVREKYDSLYTALQSRNDTARATERYLSQGVPPVSVLNADKLFFVGGTVSPTTLEKYFSCPYAGFVEKGLNLRLRDESAMLNTDTGTFVHAVLEATAKNVQSLHSQEECLAFATAEAERLIQSDEYSAFTDTSAGKYSGKRLVEECGKIAVAMYDGIVHSKFDSVKAEYPVNDAELGVKGRIDRLDSSDKYLRIVDYKTGSISDGASDYYVGKKLQLELYMSAAAKRENKIPAGIYYFPAALSFVKEGELPFQMKGFMVGTEEVVRASDTTISDGEESRFVNAKLSDKFAKNNMDEDTFKNFVAYSSVVSARAKTEMRKGFIAPTPYEGACSYCRYGGLCASLGAPVERKKVSVNCEEIANIVKGEDE